MAELFIRNPKGQFTNAMPVNADQAIRTFSQNVISNAIQNLGKRGNASGTLAKSLRAKTEIQGIKLLINFIGADYAPFVDKGVRGAGGYKGQGGNRGQGSPYRFGTGSARGTWAKFSVSMDSWLARKGIVRGRDTKTGRFIALKAVKFLIMRAIYQRGLRTSNFFTDAFKQNYNVLKTEFKGKLIEDMNRLINLNFK